MTQTRYWLVLLKGVATALNDTAFEDNDCRKVSGWFGLEVEPFTYLHHENECVQRDHGEDEVLERSGNHELPNAILDRGFVLRHVATQGPCMDCEVHALFL